jgi:Na+-transporting NADH:ubiquinone oxidoreductase subunit A
MINIKKGLDLPITGAPEQKIYDGNPVTSVAVIGFDYVGMKPTMLVKEGDQVKKGQVLFTDKKTEGVQYTAPTSGIVKAINRGERRVFQSIVIERKGDEEIQFARYEASTLATLTAEQAQQNLIESGLWTCLRTRPFSRVPVPGSKPHSIFVNAMDTRPLAANPEVIISADQASFDAGIQVLNALTDGKVFVCKASGSSVSTSTNGQTVTESFSGPHPAGLPGTHIHFLDPVNRQKKVWYLNYQDTMAIGRLFLTGSLPTERVIALSGPSVKQPRLVRTQVGANLEELCANELSEGENRIISGSVLGGRHTAKEVPYLGRFSLQVSVLAEGREREALHYLRAGINKFSVMNIYLSKLLPAKTFDFTTSTNGSERAMVPVGAYERIMPLDILPTQLLRALIVEDMDSAIALGALELDEEDLALCSYVCQSKYEYGPILRANLDRIEKEA